ncbi:hypothetical protein RJT34_16441 [Clitoria ternatea]|uniref:Calmodulin binding protein-like N-terminal domain-containing protein n=1 Tax=Clitoria ternatea TaxID=43366 RepID=A0AAN9J7E8_CLITE
MVWHMNMLNGMATCNKSEMQNQELNNLIEKIREEVESYLKGREKAFEEEKNAELQYINALKEKEAKELQQVSLDMDRLQTERVEINLDREQRTKEWAELTNCIEELEYLSICTRNVVQVGPEYVAKLNVIVLEGNFNEEVDDEWIKEYFENHEVKEREGKRPLLTGDLQVSLKEGLGTLGDLTFTDNSSWIRSRKFRLGTKVALGYCEGICIREGKTEAFAVKDHREEYEFSLI